ncbi:MAG: 50S ribosomal protein L25 [Chloroflexi bacterium]|nr:50S ribosomal protein L25 [Chloroflexota bacterium]
MRRLELEVKKRDITGKKVRFLRRGGLIPCNIYGHGIESLPVQVDVRKLSHLLARAGGTDLISIKMADAASPSNVIIRDIQRNPMTGEPIHVDFYQVRMTEKLKAEVPLVFIGEAPALKLKNVSLLHAMNTLQIEALPDDLPHNIEVDISSLAVPEQSLHVKDIKVSDKITILADPDQMIIKVAEVRKVVEEEVVPAAAVEGEEVEGAAEKAEEEAPAKASPVKEEKK